MADLPDLASVTTLRELSALLRALRRREARERGGRELTYQQLADRTGASAAALGYYLTGAVLPPTDRLDALVLALGATRAEVGAFGSARDRVADRRRSAVAGPEPIGAVSVPRELPAPPRGFVGRDQELARLDLLAFEEADTTVPLIAVTGMAGLGKTALALRWAHRVTEVFRDGQLFIDLRGYDSTGPVDPAEALARFLHSLGVRPESVALDPVERAAQFRTLVAGRRLLVVLDNAATADQVRPLVPGSPLCTVLVTSRDHLAGLVSADGAGRVPLGVLPTGEAVLLLRRLVGDRVDAEPEAALSLVRDCGGLPLALRVAAEVMTRRPNVSLGELVENLRGGQSGLDLLDTRLAARPVLSWSYRSLSAGAARTFALLGRAPRAELAIDAVASLVGLSADQTRPLLCELTSAHMLVETAPGRYAAHDAVADYAAELARSELGQEDRDAAVRRLLDHYLCSALRADRVFDPFRPPVDPPVAADAALILDFDSLEAARAWFTAEHDTLLVTVRFAIQRSRPEHAWKLAWAIATHLDRGGFWYEWATVTALVSDLPDDALATARLHGNAARAAERLKLVDTALDHYGRALDLLERIGNTRGRAVIHTNMATILSSAGSARAAVEQSEKALALYIQLGDKAGESLALNIIGYCHAVRGQHLVGLRVCRESLALARQAGDPTGEAAAWDSLGFIYHRMGEADQAIASYQMAVSVFGRHGHRWHQATSWMELGDVYADDGDAPAARDAWRSALGIFEDLDHADAAPVRARLDDLAAPAS